MITANSPHDILDALRKSSFKQGELAAFDDIDCGCDEETLRMGPFRNDDWGFAETLTEITDRAGVSEDIDEDVIEALQEHFEHGYDDFVRMHFR